MHSLPLCADTAIDTPPNADGDSHPEQEHQPLQPAGGSFGFACHLPPDTHRSLACSPRLFLDSRSLQRAPAHASRARNRKKARRPRAVCIAAAVAVVLVVVARACWCADCRSSSLRVTVLLLASLPSRHAVALTHLCPPRAIALPSLRRTGKARSFQCCARRALGPTHTFA